MIISLLINFLIIVLVAGLIYYVCDALPVPQPLNKIVKLVVVVLACLFVILALLNFTGYDIGLPRAAR